MGSLQCTVNVLCEDGSGEAVDGVVRLVDNIFLVLELDDDTNRTEDLLPDNLHIRPGFGENRGLSGSDGWMSPDATQDDKTAGVPG